MFSLTPLAVALQGIGYATLLMSLQGLVAVTIGPVEAIPSGHSVHQPRRRVRRWLPLSSAPNPYELLLEAERREEEDLLQLGML